MIDLGTYATEIVSEADRLRGIARTVSSSDWQRMMSWHSQGIPLPVVIEAVRSCFAHVAAADRARIGFAYIEPAVEELWADRRDLHVG